MERLQFIQSLIGFALGFHIRLTELLMLFSQTTSLSILPTPPMKTASEISLRKEATVRAGD